MAFTPVDAEDGLGKVPSRLRNERGTLRAVTAEPMTTDARIAPFLTVDERHRIVGWHLGES